MLVLKKAEVFKRFNLFIGYMGMVSFHIDKVLNLAQGKTNNSDLSPIDKLEIIEIKLSEMLEVRNKLIEYGDYNLQKELKDLENILDRNRKNNKLQRKRDQEQQDKLEKLIKSAKRIENQQKIQVDSNILFFRCLTAENCKLELRKLNILKIRKRKKCIMSMRLISIDMCIINISKCSAIFYISDSSICKQK